jgi:hypothetical protein
LKTNVFFNQEIQSISLLFNDSHWSPIGFHLLAQESHCFSLTHPGVLLVFIYSPRNLIGFHWLTLQSCWSSFTRNLIGFHWLAQSLLLGLDLDAMSTVIYKQYTYIVSQYEIYMYKLQRLEERWVSDYCHHTATSCMQKNCLN